MNNNENESQCDENSITTCSYLKRIIYCLKQYSSSLSYNEFVNYIINQYPQCLDDYIHTICTHCNQLNEISNYLESQHEDLIKCDSITNCQYTQRHYTRRVTEKNDNDDDNEYNFYIELFDTIHFYFFHLYELALRVKYEKKNDENKTDNDYVNCFDDEIYFIQQELERIVKKSALNFNRLNKNNRKFIIEESGYYIDSIQNESKTHGETDTLIDSMLNHMKHSYVDSEVIDNLLTYLHSEEYDTECLLLDIDIFDDDKTCNLFKCTNNGSKCIEAIKQFIKHNNIISKSFDTGFCFWYHPFYKNIDQQKQRQIQNKQRKPEQRDFGGIPIKELFVPSRYDSIQQEILYSSFLSLKQFKEKVIEKGNEFIQTEKCRKIKCEEIGDELHYDIEYFAALCVSHLHALILYCDFTDFSSEFSSTFRRTKWNEPIRSVKKRNSYFANTAKRLRELVQYYGKRGFIDKAFGPFYTGMSFCMNIPEFSIRLNGPTSTSKQKSIAARFATRDGIVIQLDNKKYPAYYERLFDSSWISAFPEEDERIFFGGRYKIQIESIIVMETKNNYETRISALFKFDAMLSGQYHFDTPTAKDIDIIDLLIKYVLGDESNENDDYLAMDEYIKQSFYLYATNKTQITLNLDNMSDIKNSSFVGIIMNAICTQKRSSNDNKNLFKPIIFKLFSNLNQITIYSSGGDRVYSFNILCLLSVLSNCTLPNSFQTIIIKDEHPYESDAWLNNTFSPKVKQAFNSKKMQIKVERGRGRKKTEDWMIITVS